MLFGGGQDKFGIGRWLFKGFQKALKAACESMCTSSMIYTLYCPICGGNAHLVNQVADIIHRIV
jgi:hypothetical protein